MQKGEVEEWDNITLYSPTTTVVDNNSPLL